FFFKDFVEIRRHYPELSKRIDKENAKRKQQMLPVLKALQKSEVLRSDLDDEDIDYIMELSGAMRTMFFVQLPESFKLNAALKKKYVDYVNRLLKPYLSI
ncbi:MAG TPA: TetR/AcrR family transcriptional regulator, partial [Bacteroidia bacterium]